MSPSSSGPSSSSSVRHQSRLIVIKRSSPDCAHLPDGAEVEKHRWLQFLLLVTLCLCAAVCLPPAGLSASLRPSEGWCPERKQRGIAAGDFRALETTVLSAPPDSHSTGKLVSIRRVYLADFNLKRVDTWRNWRERRSIRKIFVMSN